MKILIVDDERIAVKSLREVLTRVLGSEAEFAEAANGLQALEEADRLHPDVAFVDIEMPGMSGLELSKRLKELHPRTNIVLVTAYPQYSLEAWHLHVSDYLIKPADEKDVRGALENLRTPLPEKRADDRLTVQCFGNFEVFYKGRIISFPRSGAKELLAYLVSRRGAGVTSGELCGILWEDGRNVRRQKTYIRQYYLAARKALEQEGLKDVVRHTREAYSVNTDMLDCDYYRFLAMDPAAVNSYRGEFMAQYSWSEFILPGLDELAGGLKE